MKEIELFINKHMESKKYITSLEELYILFEKNNIPYDERNIILQKVDLYNQELYKVEQRKAKELQKLEDTEIRKIMESPSINKIETVAVKQTKKPIISIDVSSYMTKIREKKESLEQILPTPDSENYIDILNTILIEIYKEKIDIINLLHEQNIEEQEIKEMFSLEIDSLDNLMEEIINKRDCTEEQEESIQNHENQLWFLKNSVGKPYLLSNLKGMEEYYESFQELLTSIIAGNFKNVRVFQNNNKLLKLMEVKGHKTRILFSRLDEDKFVIIDAFVKKCDTDLRHRMTIERASNLYQCQRDYFLNSLQDETVIEQEKQYTKELFEMLHQNKRGGM